MKLEQVRSQEVAVRQQAQQVVAAKLPATARTSSLLDKDQHVAEDGVHDCMHACTGC